MENKDLATVTENEVFEFKCSEGGVPRCDWTMSGENVELLLFQVEMHAQNFHNLVIDEAGKEKIRSLITRQ